MARSRTLLLLALASSGAAFSSCGGSGSTSSSGYVPPPRQEPVLPDSLDFQGCTDSTMGGGLLAVCDPVLLKRAYENHTLNQPGTLDVTIPGRKLRVGSGAGLTQVLPDDGIGTLFAPATVTLDGKVSNGSYLYISARSSKPEHLARGEALFRHLGLERGGTATVDVELDAGQVVFSVRRRDGTIVRPLRYMHVEGPGPKAELPPLPAHYADTPQQGVRTFVAAINARDGKTICQLWTAQLRERFSTEDYPCWAAV